MIGKLKDLYKTESGEWFVSFTTRDNPVTTYHRLKSAPVSIEIKKVSNPRSRDANAFCWAMCSDIGKAINPPISKEDVYRKAIREVGKYTPLLMKTEAVPAFIHGWQEHGIGWFVDIVDDSRKNPGCKVVFAYYGTSTYTVEEMAKVLDFLTDEMEQMELPIPISKSDEERLLAQWGRALSKKNESVTSADVKQG